MADSNPSDLTYESITERGHAIRLLTLYAGQHEDDITCTLQTVLLCSSPIYEALSYAWGSPDLTQSITVDGKTLKVTNNLAVVLRYLRKSDEDVVLWVDAICINQKDVGERTHQVRMMGDIFRRCKSVYVWLGIPDSDNTSTGMLMTL
jgi:hypothetical protein